MYIIRKSKNGIFSATPSGKTSAYIFIILSLLFGAIFGYYCITDKDNIGIGTIIFISLILLLCFYVGIKIYISDTKINKLKGYKKTGGGISKKLKITSIERYYDPGDKNSNGFDGHYLEAQEGDKIYCSNAFEGGKFHGTSLEELKKIYKYYGFEYDEKNKNNVIRKIESEILKNELEAQADGFLKAQSKRMNVCIDKKRLDAVKKGYIIPHIEINGHKISVGDTVDVYIDPNDDKNYWMDINFLFDK